MFNISKKSVLKIGLILLFCVNYFIVNGQRNLIYTHGLQETNQAWQVYTSHFESIHNSINTVNESYTTTNGLVSAANEIKQDLDNQLGTNNTNPNNIGIAHSTAGLAYRHIDGTTSSNNKRFGGFITVGTPYEGVYFADAQNNGDLAAYTTDANDKLELATSYIVNNQIWTDVGMANYGQSFASQYLGTTSSQTNVDLRTNSTFLNNLPATFSRPVISINGSENAKAQWRLLSSFEQKPYLLALDNLGSEDVLTAANGIEQSYKGAIITSSVNIAIAVTVLAAGVYVGVAVAAATGAINAFYLGTGIGLLGGGIIGGSDIRRLAKAIKGRNWFRDAETKWKNLTGAIRTQTYSYSYFGMTQACLNNIAQFGWGWYYGSPANQANCWSNVTTVVGTQYINEASDGLIPKSSTLIPNSNNLTSLEALGANHFELYNHPSVKARFEEAYLGTHGTFFQL